MSDRFAFLFLAIVFFVMGSFALVNPQAVKKENADVPGFHKTGFAMMPIWAFRLVGAAIVGLSSFFLYVFATH
jgi:hypothetical protein